MPQIVCSIGIPVLMWEKSHMYRIKVKAAKGASPYFENEKSDEKRRLGVFFEFDLTPAGPTK